MVTLRDRHGRTSLGCLGTIVLFVVIGYLAAELGPPWLRYQQFNDEMRSAARYGVSLPDSVIRARIMARADSLRLPLAAHHVVIVRHRGTNGTIRISAPYTETIHLLLLGDRTLHFKPSAEESL
ncbi:MAG TPA: hypothetical protein VHW65_10145 [Gemmatimonadales bacterium]|nr:hypothetical protein [Gemmatimonadales bacterium]